MIKYEVTRDPRLLEQYYDLREECFRKELSIPDFDGAEEEQDRQGAHPHRTQEWTVCRRGPYIIRIPVRRAP